MSNLLYVDQPTGTGFSYSTDLRDIRHNEKGVSNDLYDFLQVPVFALESECFLKRVFSLFSLCLDSLILLITEEWLVGEIS